MHNSFFALSSLLPSSPLTWPTVYSLHLSVWASVAESYIAVWPWLPVVGLYSGLDCVWNRKNVANVALCVYLSAHITTVVTLTVTGCFFKLTWAAGGLYKPIRPTEIITRVHCWRLSFSCCLVFACLCVCPGPYRTRLVSGHEGQGRTNKQRESEGVGPIMRQIWVRRWRSKWMSANPKIHQNRIKSR